MQASITPVTVFPSTASVLYVGNNFSTTLNNGSTFAQFYYELRGADVPGTPPTAGPTLKNGNVSMTTAQWDAWPADGSDQSYVLSCLSTNLGLTLA